MSRTLPARARLLQAAVLVLALMLLPAAIAQAGTTSPTKRAAKHRCAKAKSHAKGTKRSKACHKARVAVKVSSASRTAAPVLRVSGTTVSWAKVSDVTSYVLATKVPGLATSYRTVGCCSVTPAAVPGATVRYGLRTNVSGSLWASEVSVTYPVDAAAPATTTQAATSTTVADPVAVATPSATATPAATSTPAATATPAATSTPVATATPVATSTPVATATPALPSTSDAGGFAAGMVSGSDVVNYARYMKPLAAKEVRVEFDISTPAANLANAIAAHAANGTRVLLLAGFHARMPTVAEAQNLATWAAAYGPGGTYWATHPGGQYAVEAIEFGNETSYGYQYGDNWDKPTYIQRAKDYALRVKDASIAIAAANPRMGLLAQADDANTGSSNWVDGMFSAVPDLASRIAGWSTHPYGPQTRWQPRLDRLKSQTGKYGASNLPIWITEWGIATDDGRCLDDNGGWDKCMTYAAAATALTDSVAAMRARYGAQLHRIYLYQGIDQRASGVDTNPEHYFGVLKLDSSDKGAYSAAVRSVLAAA